RRHFAFSALACMLAAISIPAPVAHAADWPNRQIVIICPYGAGSSSDRVLRVIGAVLSESLKVPVIVEYRVGAGGLIGADAVARARPDGYTLLISGVAQITASLTNKTTTVDVIND